MDWIGLVFSPLLPGMSHAAGVIVFCEGKQRQVLTVETKRHGNWGFPKGSHEKGEVWYQTAVRELLEESGVTVEQLNILEPYDTFTVSEMTPKGNIGVQYLIASLRVAQKDVILQPQVCIP